MSKRAVLYARVSGDDRHNESRNLKGQLDLCRQYALQHGYEVIEELAEDDRGASGAAFELPQLNKVRDLAQMKAFDVLVTRELDRLSRNLAKQLFVEEELKRNGVVLEYALAEYADTPEGNLMKNIRACVAEFERLKINERMERGKRLKIKAGSVMVARRPPFGYSVVTEDKKQTLVINEAEAKIVRMIFGWYTDGDDDQQLMSQRGIQRRLNDLGIPTPADLSHKWAHKKRGWAQWNQSSIRAILGNTSYVGKWRYSKHPPRNERRERGSDAIPLEVDVPAIIDQEMWDLAQHRLVKNREDSRRNLKYDYLLNRRLQCGRCGAAIGCDPAHARRIYQYYRCRATGRAALLDYAHQCDLPSFRAEHVDPVVWEWTRSLLLDEDVLTKALTAMQSEHDREAEPLRERLSAVEDLIKENQTQLERLVDLYLTGTFSMEMLESRKTRLESSIGELTRERDALQKRLRTEVLTPEQIRDVQAFAARVAKKLEQADQCHAARKEIIEMLDVRGTLAVEDGKKVIHVRCLLGSEDFPIVNTRTPAYAVRTRASRRGTAPRDAPG